MKKIIFSTLVLAATSLFAAQNDVLLTFSTKGPDTYANGDPVADGECYCVVWIQDGYSFEGFDADGTARGEHAQVVLTAPVAKGGCCPKTQFQISYKKADALGAGKYGVYLLDTRSADTGKPMGTVKVDGVWLAKAINSWGVVADATAELATLDSLGTTTIASSGATATASPSLTPVDAPKPRISGIRVVNGRVELDVADTATYLQYTVEAGIEPSTNALKKVESIAAQGNGDVITISYPIEMGGKFFRATRR